MQLTTEQLQQINIEVDSYYMGIAGVMCLCVYATLNTDAGKGRFVNINDIREKVADKTGMVECWGYQDGNGDSKPYRIAFGTWFEQNKNTIEFLDTLSDIINKREGRKPLNHVVTFPETPKLNIYLNEVKNTELS